MASPIRCLLLTVSWGLAHAPDFAVAGLCRLLGRLSYSFSSRRHDILSALDHAFPEKDAAWRERICRLHCTRMFEMFLIVLAMRHWSPREMRDRIRFSPGLEAFLAGPAQERPSVLFLSHASTTEALAVLPAIAANFPPSLTLYRALDHPIADAFVKECREFAGNHLHARRDGLLKAKKALQSGRNTVGILFDQSAGFKGHLTLLFDRLCTTSNLPALLATRTDATAVLMYVRRDGFWRGTIEVYPLPATQNPAELLRAANARLEEILRTNDSQCADWFWAHKRWKATIRKESILNLEGLKSYLPDELRARGLDHLPRHTRITLRLDPRPALLPLAHRFAALIREKRPDALLWLLVPEGLAASDLPPRDEAFRLPRTKYARCSALKKLNAERYPDALFSLDPGAEAVAEARLIQCDFRSGFSLAPAPKRTFHAHVVVKDNEYLEHPLAAMVDFLKLLGIDRAEAEAHSPPPA